MSFPSLSWKDPLPLSRPLFLVLNLLRGTWASHCGPHKGPRTTPTQAQPTLSGPADTRAQNCSIPSPFLAGNPNLRQTPATKSPTQGFQLPCLPVQSKGYIF